MPRYEYILTNSQKTFMGAFSSSKKAIAKVCSMSKDKPEINTDKLKNVTIALRLKNNNKLQIFQILKVTEDQIITEN